MPFLSTAGIMFATGQNAWNNITINLPTTDDNTLKWNGNDIVILR